MYGILEFLGFSGLLLKLFIDILIFSILIFHLSKTNYKLPGIGLITLLSFEIFISSIINQSDIYSSLTYYRIFIYPYLIFLFVYNSRLNIYSWWKFFAGLFILQIIISFVKYLSIGVMEKGLIGSLTISGGTYSTIFPLFAISLLISLYIIYKRDNKYILLIIGFLFMGFVGAKRGIWFFLPLILIIIYFLYRKIMKLRFFTKKSLYFLILIPIIGFTILYVGTKYNSTLNPQGKIGGKFNPEYVKNYTLNYTFKEDESDNITNGRGANFLNIITKYSKSQLKVILFGYGPGEVKGTSVYGEGIWGDLGISGPVTGFSSMLVTLGFLGSLLIIILVTKCGIIFYKSSQCQKSRFYKAISFGGIIVSFLFFLDYFFYSSSFFGTIFPISFLYAFLIAVILKDYNINVKYKDNFENTSNPS